MKKILYFICALLLTCFISIVRADIIIYAVEEHVAYNVLKDMPSTFGEPIPFQGFEGMLALANPSDGCTQIDPPPKIHNTAKKWIVLVARHNCSYEMKVRVAQNATYDAVIVHNVDSDNLIAMTANNTTAIHIPSVFIGAYDANYLKELYSNVQFYLIITPDAPFNINTHLLLPFAIVVGLLFLFMIIFMVVKCIKDRSRARRHRLPTSALNKMLLHKFVKGDPYETCAICLDDYIEGEKLRVLPCAHAYHSKCIDPWLTNNRRVCPICKRKVFAQNEEPCSSDSDTDDDTTPLINASNQNQATGGTFGVANEVIPSPEIARREFARLLGYIRDHQIMLGSNYPSINGDSSAEVSQSTSSQTSATEQTAETQNRHCPNTYEVHVHTRPESASSSDNDVVI